MLRGHNKSHVTRKDLKSRNAAIHAAVTIPVRLVSGLILLVLLGTSVLMLPGIGSHRQLHFNEALFTAASALSVTGLSIITPYTDLTIPGKIVLMCLIQIGGVGYMVLAITAFRLLGRNISHVDRLALSDSLGLVNPQGIMSLFRSILITVTAIEGIGAFFLWLHWRHQMPSLEAAFYGIFHAISAFCNAGFDLFVGREGYFGGVPNDSYTLIVIGSLIFFGSLGIPVLFDLITYPSRRNLSLHTKITLPLVGCLIIFGGLGFTVSEGFGRGVLEGESAARSMLIGIFHAISARTAGFPGVPEFADMRSATSLILIVLMFIGSSPASMGGGITTGTFAVLILALYAHMRGWSVPVIHGRALPGSTIRRAAAVLMTSLLVVTLSTWLILVTHNLHLEEVAFEVVSAFATCGLTLGSTMELNFFGQLVIVFVMLWGRLGALTIVVALTRPRPKQLVTYPEERILIG